MSLESASRVIERLELQPHPEGGWYRELHRSTQQVQTTRGPRSALTTIYYLLEEGQLSRWHVVDSDEVWHFYTGSPLELLAYDPVSRALRATVLSTPSDAYTAVDTIPASVWQAARPLGEYSLVGCSVGPGFDFADFKFVSALADHASHFSGELARYRGLL